MRDPTRVSTFAAFVLALLLPATAPAATQVALTTADGRGVSNVQVFVTSLETGALRGGATDSKGRVSFRDLAAGHAQVRVLELSKVSGGREGWRYIRVTPGQAQTVTIPYDGLIGRDDYSSIVAKDGISAARAGDQAGYGESLDELTRRVSNESEALAALNPVFDTVWDSLAADLSPERRSQLEAALKSGKPTEIPDHIDAARERAAGSGDTAAAAALARMAYLARARAMHRRNLLDAMAALGRLKAAGGR